MPTPKPSRFALHNAAAQALGYPKANHLNTPFISRWGSRTGIPNGAAYCLPGGLTLFLGPNGAVRVGTSPSNSHSNPAMAKRLAAKVQALTANWPQTLPQAARPKAPRLLTLDETA